MYTLIISYDLQGEGCYGNAVNRRFFSQANALRWLREWEQDYGRHLPFQYNGSQYCWDLYAPNGMRITDFISRWWRYGDKR